MRCLVSAILLLACVAAAAPRPFVTKAPNIESVKYAGRGRASVSFEARLSDGQSVPLRVDVLSSHLVRVRTDRDGSFAATLQENDGFLKTDWPEVLFEVDNGSNQVEIAAPGVTVAITKSPFKIAFLQNGRVLAETAGVNQGTKDVMLAMASPAGEQFYGFCDQGSGGGDPVRPDRAPLRHRGHVLTMASLTCDRIYYSPFFLSSRGCGFFLNTLVRSD